MERRAAAKRKKARRTYCSRHTPEFRLRVVREVLEEHVAVGEVAKVFNVTGHTIYNWLKLYRRGGDAALGVKKPGPKVAAHVPDARRDAVVAMKQAFSHFGARKIADTLRRFDAIGVSESQVRRILHQEGLLPVQTPQLPKAPPSPRRFERAQPNQMWQSDIFEFWLRRHQKLYVTAFLDDNSRFVVSHVLAHHHKATLVLEALERGVAAYGAPREVLTDNGRQYTAWRGTTAFEELLRQYGIRHIRSSPQHPMTLGKVERFWKTLWEEFLSRTTFSDFADCEQRLALFIQAYNFKRPHQGIDGLVPADRFFSAAPHVRAAIEKNVADNALRMSLAQPTRKPFYLVGRLGDRDVSIAAAGDGLQVQLGDEKPQTIQLPKENNDEAHQEPARFQRQPQSAPLEADAEVAQRAAGPRRDGEAPHDDGAASPVGGARGDGRHHRGENLAGDVLPARDEGAARDAQGAGAWSGTDGHPWRGWDGEAHLGAGGAGETAVAGETARGAAALSHQEAGEEGTDGFAAARAAEEDELILIDEQWGQKFDAVGDEHDDARVGAAPFDADEGWRELALTWGRKLAGAEAPGGVDERRRADEDERLPEDTRGAAGSAPALRGSAGGVGEGAVGNAGGSAGWLVAQPVPDADAPRPAWLVGGSLAEAAGQKAEAAPGSGAGGGARAAEEGERPTAGARGDGGPAARSDERPGAGEAEAQWPVAPGGSGTKPGGGRP